MTISDSIMANCHSVTPSISTGDNFLPVLSKIVLCLHKPDGAEGKCFKEYFKAFKDTVYKDYSQRNSSVASHTERLCCLPMKKLSECCNRVYSKRNGEKSLLC